jgi:hypothetical protein
MVLEGRHAVCHSDCQNNDKTSEYYAAHLSPRRSILEFLLEFVLCHGGHFFKIVYDVGYIQYHKRSFSTESKMKRICLLPLLLLAALCVSGCCTMYYGTTDEVSIVTDPPGAQVTIGPHRVTTPAKIDLDKSFSYVAQIRMEGYQPENIPIISLRKDTSGGFFSNLAWSIFLIGIPFFIIDGAVDSNRKFSRNEIRVTLVTASKPEAPAAQEGEAK